MPVQIISAVALISVIASFVCWIMAMNRRTSDEPLFSSRFRFNLFKSDWFTPTGYKLWVAAHVGFWLFALLGVVRFAFFQ